MRTGVLSTGPVRADQSRTDLLLVIGHSSIGDFRQNAVRRLQIVKRKRSSGLLASEVENAVSSL